MPRAKMIFSLAFLATVHLSVSADPGAASAFRLFQVAEMPAPVYYFAPHRIEDGSRCETAAILIHGWGGGCNLTGDVEPFAAALAKAVGPSNTAPYVISPLFPRRRILQKNGKDDGRAVWNDSWGRDLSKRGSPEDDWRGGGDAVGVKLSSFDVVDAILLALGDRARYPALKRVIVTGFSAGGQFVGRYVAVGKGFVREGVEVRYAAMGPSTELWLDEDVLWHYGIKGRPRYSAQMTREQMLNNLSSRRVWRACGTADVLGKSLDVCPEAMRQGANRYARFCNFKAYLKQFPAWAKQVSFHAIEGVGHESKVAHTEKVFMDYVLGDSVPDAKTSGAFEKLPTVFDGKTPVVVETKAFKLVINPDATAQSLVIKATGEEMLEPREGIPVFATTQTRPFNNEIRLVQQAKRTTYPANRVRREGDRIYIGFETAPYEVAVRVEETAAGYVTFRPERLISNTEQEHQYWHWNMDVPPVDSFRLLQLPVKNRENFGDWLNVMWDGRGCVGVMGGTPYMDVDNERRWGFRKLTVEALKDFGVTNGVAVLAAAATPAAFLDQVDAAEAAAGMPRGVQSRRDSRLNASLYWTEDIRPENVDEHIAYAKAGGFRMMLIYYTALVNGGRRGYRTLPDYSWGNGWSRESFTAAVRKLNAAGITVGFHTLQTFIGFDSSYVTPEADHRLALVKHYTLARPLPASETPCDVYVEQNPVAAPLHPKCRILKFGTELMEYTGYVTERPYRFTGVKRRHLGTYAKEHPLGEIGGVLGVSECAAISSYIDQDTSLQDEIGDKIADIYDCGIEFLYFDGSEDANPPCTVNISLSQIRCAARCTARSGRPPLFTEGCAKSHFGWHLQSGANAFDVFSPEMFKRKIIEYPYAAAQRLAKDFTRVDFGWWRFGPPVLEGPPPSTEGLWNRAARTVGVQPDIWEYGTSKAAAFDCPATMQMKLVRLRQHRRTADILETVRRWEDVRARKWLTPEQKEMLKDPNREFHLYRNEKGDYELLEWKQLDVAGGQWTDVRAFLFERNGKRVVAYWHTHDCGRLVFALPLDGTASLDAANMKYFETLLPAEAVRKAFASATIHQLPTTNYQLSTTNYQLPPRHIPKRIMGRDYWPALYKYRDWMPDAKYDNSTFEVRFDNPDIFKLPAFRDAVPVYWARNDPPSVEGASGTWRHFADNFRSADRDREILDSNPHPDRPFLFAATANRKFWTWGADIDLDNDEHARWKATHPNALYDGTILEWDNDLMLAYRRLKGLTNDVRRAKVEALIGKHPPKTREERMAIMRRHFADRHKAAYGGKMAVHASHVFSQHLGADCGADVLVVETSNTSGSPTGNSEYRWNLAPMFVRGAARQFDRPWEWYWAAYMNGFRSNGEWLNNAACRYPERPDYGTSANLMRRLYYFSYLSGANITQPEEWSAYFLMWDEKAGKTVLTPRGRDYVAYHDFTRAHPGRGVPYAPVAICIPLSRGYSAFGGWPWAETAYGYTRSDLMSDAVLFSLIPGFERAKAMKAGVETNLHNSRFAQMYDVICPDAPSQSAETTLDVMKSYRALVVAGEFADPKVTTCLADYEKSGGRVIHISTTEYTEYAENGWLSNSVCSMSSVVDLMPKLKVGKVRFPEIETIFEGLQKDYFPFKVEGDCLYGANRTEGGWWLWVFNNKGVTKFADAPHTVDHSFDADIKVSCAKGCITAVKELLAEKPMNVENGAFKHRIAAGDLAVFGIRARREQPLVSLRPRSVTQRGTAL